MFAIYRKELSAFLSSLTGYIVMGVFLVFMSLMIWVFPDTSVLYYQYATLDQLFSIAPFLFIFLVPAVCMRSFSEEMQTGTMELLSTRPVSALSIVLSKYFAALTLVLIALIPTLIYYYSIHHLGAPKGNLDSGAIAGSYLGLILLSGVFVSMGLFASSLTKNQIVAFTIGAFIIFIGYQGFEYLSKIPVFVGKIDHVIQQIGIDQHYRSISKGVIDSRDIIYFISVKSLFILLTLYSLIKKKG